jgi:hypothetical protein
MIARDPLHRFGQAAFPHQMWLRTFDAECGEIKDVAKWF